VWWPQQSLRESSQLLLHGCELGRQGAKLLEQIEELGWQRR